MFKSIETYKFKNNGTGITLTGSGMVTIIESSNDVNNYYSRQGLISIDGNTICPAKGDIYLFKSSLKIFTDTDDNYSEIIATAGLFN